MGLNFQIVHYYGDDDGPISLRNKHVYEVGPHYQGINIMKVVHIRNYAFLIYIPRILHKFFAARLFSEYAELLDLDEESLTIDEDNNN